MNYDKSHLFWHSELNDWVVGEDVWMDKKTGLLVRDQTQPYLGKISPLHRMVSKLSELCTNPVTVYAVVVEE